MTVYKEMGGEPTPVDERYRSGDVVSAYDLKLPLPETPEMQRLAEQLQLRTEDEVELDENGWPRVP